MAQADYQKQYPANDIEWWTYEEYAAFIEQQKTALQIMADENATGYTSSNGEFTWTQGMVDEAIERYEQDLENLKNGTRISKSISSYGDDSAEYESDSPYPEDTAAYIVEIVLSDGTTKQSSGANKGTVSEQVKDYCDEQVAAQKLTQEEANKILSGVQI